MYLFLSRLSNAVGSTIAVKCGECSGLTTRDAGTQQVGCSCTVHARLSREMARLGCLA